MRNYQVAVFLVCLMQIGCKSISYFNTPNDVLETKAMLYMQNGSKKEGNITVLFETGHTAKEFIEFTSNNLKEKIPIDSIRCYQIKNNFYYPRILDYELNGSENLLFVKRLSNDSSLIHLFELYVRNPANSASPETYYYFLSFPKQDSTRPINIASKKIMPNFDEKMSTLVEDCPQLAYKVKTKAKGYFLPQISFGNTRKTEILLRIINEYNSCR
ncbi:MAG: hypothetical protein JST02_02050 [Bacteroidetes bacterium]|nr:hypothetical protein [Bacteroidota bacterium]